MAPFDRLEADVALGRGEGLLEASAMLLESVYGVVYCGGALCAGARCGSASKGKLLGLVLGRVLISLLCDRFKGGERKDLLRSLSDLDRFVWSAAPFMSYALVALSLI